MPVKASSFASSTSGSSATMYSSPTSSSNQVGFGKSRDDGEKRVRLERLRHELDHPGRKARLPVLAHGICGHRDDWDLTGGRSQSADLSGGFQPIHLRHLHVHERASKAPVRAAFTASSPFTRALDGITRAFQERTCHHDIDVVVLGQKGSGRATGRS